MRRRPKDPPGIQGRKGGNLTDVVAISVGPAKAAHRAETGHSEGDLVLGRSGRSQIQTGLIVDHNCWFVPLGALPENRKAATVRDAITEKIVELPQQVAVTPTWHPGGQGQGGTGA